ncbi:MAG: hypothetical protein IKP43_11610 [Bacteroidaceae bacterium]|nr:hypothetical protein [Bacteroidaceae bacterium]
MKRTLFLLFMLLLTLSSHSQTVTLSINEGLNNKPTLKTNIEREIGKLLTEFNNAARNNRGLNLSGINMTPNGKEDLKEMYDFLPFSCDDRHYSERCIQTVTGYCVRGILVTIKPMPDYTDERERELTISFAADGQITSAVFSFHDPKVFLGNATEVKDVARRNEILNFTENYRSYYDKKDIDMIDSVFSDDAIVITGKVIYRKTPEFGRLVKDVEYKQQDKQQYLSHLRTIFKNNKYIRVQFKDIEVMRHPKRSDMYMVTLHQDWTSTKYNGSGYHDTGFVQLFWQFSDQDKNPQILFRSWQSDELVKSNKDNLFSFDDCNIPPVR